MNELISVIIPAYNIRNYIERCLDSVRAQTYEHLEIIVVDDGSTDGTGEFLDHYVQRDERLLIIHQENSGVTKARLKGISEASGVWIGFVDGDDYIKPDMYERLLKNAHEYDADISHCGYRMVYPDGKEDFYYNSGKVVVDEGQNGCQELLKGDRIEPGLWNKLYRTDLMKGLTEWMNPEIRINEDLLMNFYFFRESRKSIWEDFCPYYYILRGGSASVSKINRNKMEDPLKVMYILNYETRDIPDQNEIVFQRLVYQLISSATLGLGDQRDMIEPFRKQARRELRSLLGKILCGKVCGIKLKVMACWAGFWPDCYRWIHQVYAHIRGTDRKYAVD